MVHLLGQYLIIVKILVGNIKLKLTYWITNNKNYSSNPCWKYKPSARLAPARLRLANFDIINDVNNGLKCFSYSPTPTPNSYSRLLLSDSYSSTPTHRLLLPGSYSYSLTPTPIPTPTPTPNSYSRLLLPTPNMKCQCMWSREGCLVGGGDHGCPVWLVGQICPKWDKSVNFLNTF